MRVDDWAGDAGSFEAQGIQFAVKLSGDEPSSAMQIRVDFAGMSTGLRPFNKRHATIVRNYVNLLSRAVVLLAFALAASGCPARVVHPSQCVALEAEGQNCHSCSEPSQLSPASTARLAREILARVISADRKEHAFLGTSDGPRFYRVNGGALQIPGVETTRHIDDLNAAAKAEPWKDLVFVDIEVLGASASDSIYVRVTVTPRAWMPDYARFGDDPATGTYCLRWSGTSVQVTVITPPIFLSERRAAAVTSA